MKVYERPIMILNNFIDMTFNKFGHLTLSTRPGLLEAWLALTSVKHHGNL